MPTARRYTTTTRRTTNTNRSWTTKNRNTWTANKYTGLRQDIKWKIGSYRNIYSQVTGPGMVTTFSPRMAMQWTNYVNNGAKVYKFTGTQFTKAFGGQWDPNFTPTNATRWLRQKFGRSIKAVAHGRGSTWLVATTTNINKGPFKNYTWK